MAEDSRFGWIVMRGPDRGLDPRIHQLGLNLMDCRVKPRSIAAAILSYHDRTVTAIAS